MSLAAAGYLCACVVGVTTVRYLAGKGRLKTGSSRSQSGSVTVDTFQDQNEIPLSESVDRLSIQVALVLLIVAVGLVERLARKRMGVPA